MTEPTIRSLFTFKIPDYWTPDQALAMQVGKAGGELARSIIG